MKSKTCCFTGHRPKYLPWGNNEYTMGCCDLKGKLFHQIQKAVLDGYNHFIFGAALGIDTYVGELLILMKKIYPAISIEAAIPCANQSKKWSLINSERYNDILSLCDKKTIISDVYTPSCMRDRNRYMVDNSSLLITVWNGKPSGTSYTIKYAESKGMEIIIINI